MSDFRHLVVVFADFWKLYDYPKLRYYVVNLATKLAFYAPDYVHDLEEAKVIPAYFVGMEQDKPNDFFKKHEITLARRLPHPAELESPTGAGSDLMIKGLVEVLLAEMLEKNAGKTAKKQQDKVED